MADKKDEIISMQLDLIRQMTENNIRRLSDDIWGPSRRQNGQNAQSSKGKGKRTGLSSPPPCRRFPRRATRAPGSNPTRT